MGEQGASGKTQTEEGSLKDVGKRDRPLGKNIGCKVRTCRKVMERLRSIWN